VAFTHKNSRGQEYFLHTTKVTLKGGHERSIYYFAKAVDAAKALDAVPAGYVVSENKATGLPLLKKG